MSNEKDRLIEQHAHYPIPDDLKILFNGDGSSVVGMTIGTRHSIGVCIGEGGNADVHIGWDHRNGKKVAIKIAHSLGDTQKSEVLYQETLSQAKLEASNPYVIRVYGVKRLDYGFFEDNPTIATILQYLGEDEGYSTLKTHIKRDTLSPTDKVNILRQSALGLDLQHKVGTIHSDFKPDNAYYCPQDNLYVYGDFGAHPMYLQLKNNPDNIGVTVGTPRYMSPDAYLGQAPSFTDDLWGHAITAFEIITGKLPFGISDMRSKSDIANAILNANGLSKDDQDLLSLKLSDMGIKDSTKQDQIMGQFYFAFRSLVSERFDTAADFAYPIANIIEEAINSAAV